MDYLNDVDLVVAVLDEDGDGRFVEIDPPFEKYSQGQSESSWMWQTTVTDTLPAGGSVPTAMWYPAPGGTIFGLVCFPPHSAGKREMSSFVGDPNISIGAFDDPAMHSSKTVDYEIILSGKIDIELPGGEIRTLGPGSCIIMAGAPHAWKNHYDEPCIYAAVVVGVAAEDD